MSDNRLKKCKWCLSDPIYEAYHDNEWGKPTYDSNELFELLCLEGAQAGLSWITILKKRENYRDAFFGFEPERMASISEEYRQELLQNEGIVRNKLKVNAFIENAKAYLDFTKENNFSDFLWSFVGGTIQDNQFTGINDIPSETDTSKAMGKALKKIGFRFVGPTICYAFMQSAGMVNDHILGCPARGN